MFFTNKSLLASAFCVSAGLVSMNASAQTLKEAMAGAFTVDPSLRSATFNRDAASENVALAISRLLPQVSLQGSDQKLTQTTTQDSLVGPLSRTFSGPSKNYQMVLRQALLRPRDVAGLDVAKAQKENGDFKYLSELADSRLRAAGAWFDVLAAQNVLEAYEATLIPYEKAADQEQMRLKGGDGTRDGVLEAKAQLESSRAMVNDARLNLAAKQRAFTLATGLPFDAMGKVALPHMKQTFLNGLEKQQLWEKITQTSSDIQAAKTIEQIQQARLRQSQHDHLPSADLVASYNQAQNDATSTQGIRYQNKQIGVQFNVPIYSGGGISAAQRQQLAIYEASVSDRMSLELRMEQEFINSWATQQGQVERITAGGMLLDASLDQLNGVKKALSLGLKTWGEVAQAQSAVARRTADQVNNLVTLYKTQLRILRMLSAEDEYWEQWTNLFNVESIKAAKN
jgi:outer membrane protein TolC